MDAPTRDLSNFMLARDLWAIGLASCQQAEQRGVILAIDEDSRQQIDFFIDLFIKHQDCCKIS